MPMGLYKCNITPRVSMKKPNPGQGPQAQCQCPARSKPQQVDHLCFTRVDVLPRKPLFWLAWFVTVCLFVVYCVLARNVSRMQEIHASAHHKTAAFHIHMKKRKEKHIRSFFSFLSESFSRCCRSGVARNRIELWFAGTKVSL